MYRLIGGLLAIAMGIATLAPASATVVSGTTTVKWMATSIVRLTLTPNYSAGYGSIPAVFGTQPAPTHGIDAPAVGSGAVDFGTVLAGDTYIYRYAVHLNVFTNSSTGFNLYGEGAADFYNQTDSTTAPIGQTMFYVHSTATGDANTGFTPGLPFQKTTAPVTGGGSFATAPTINYGSYPAPVAASNVAAGDFYYDYQMHVPPTATAGSYFVWIVYTVVPQ
jgi:hypothetical protein